MTSLSATELSSENLTLVPCFRVLNGAGVAAQLATLDGILQEPLCSAAMVYMMELDQWLAIIIIQLATKMFTARVIYPSPTPQRRKMNQITSNEWVLNCPLCKIFTPKVFKLQNNDIVLAWMKLG